MMKGVNILIISVLMMFFSCSEKEENLKQEAESNSSVIKYAKGFSIEDFSTYKVISLTNTWRGGNNNFKYVLYKDKPPVGYKNATFIKVPISKIACTSVTHIALLDKLNQLSSVVAMSGSDYVSNSTFLTFLNEGRIKELGNYQALNYEVLIDEKPDFIMVYGVDESSNKQIKKMKELKLNVVLNAEYMEDHPLGKFEWIKFVGAFYNLEKETEALFNKVEEEYLKLTALTENIQDKPEVFTGMPWNGVWYVPGGKSFVAQQFKDAGANYIWANNNERGSYGKDIEVIVNDAFTTDFWLNQNSFSSLSAIAEYDEKLKNFKAFKKQQLYNNNKRINEKGGNDYWESGVVNPHVILKDLIEIFHPELLEHELYYYKKLN